MKKYFLFLIIIGFSSLALGQDILNTKKEELNVTINSFSNNEIATLLKKANSYSIKHVDSATLYFDKATALANSMDSKAQMAEVLLSEAKYYHNRYHYIEAIKYFEKSLLIASRTKRSQETSFS